MLNKENNIKDLSLAKKMNMWVANQKPFHMGKNSEVIWKLSQWPQFEFSKKMKEKNKFYTIPFSNNVIITQ